MPHSGTIRKFSPPTIARLVYRLRGHTLHKSDRKPSASGGEHRTASMEVGKGQARLSIGLFSSPGGRRSPSWVDVIWPSRSAAASAPLEPSQAGPRCERRGSHSFKTALGLPRRPVGVQRPRSAYSHLAPSLHFFTGAGAVTFPPVWGDASGAA